MLNKKKIAVIIPAYNEEESIPFVLKDIPKWIDRIIVIDNGSTDHTFEIAENEKVEVFKENKRGYGNACLKGISKLKNEDIIVFLDADYSDYPEEILSIVEPIIKKRADIVISNRFNSKLEDNAMTSVQQIGNHLSVFLIQLFWNYKYSDLGPLRAILRTSLFQLDMKDKNYGWTIEMQIKAIQHKLKIEQIDVSYRNRIGKSKISGTISGVCKAGFKILYKIFYFKLKEIL